MNFYSSQYYSLSSSFDEDQTHTHDSKMKEKCVSMTRQSFVLCSELFFWRIKINLLTDNEKNQNKNFFAMLNEIGQNPQ